MEIVASKFERDGLIDYKEFVNSLKDKKPVRRNSFNHNTTAGVRGQAFTVTQSWLGILKSLRN